MTYYILYFSLYSFLGWCIETTFTSLRDFRFTNRGFLHGPVCPMYGFSSVILIFFAKYLEGNLFILYIFCVVGASVIEYACGYLLETLFNAKWWDYSSNRFNIKGRICLSFSLAWGLAGVFFIKVLQPLINGFMVKFISHYMAIILSIVLIIYFSLDLIFTLYKLSKLKGLFLQLEDTMTEIKSTLLHLKGLAFDKVTSVGSKSKDLLADSEIFSKDIWNRREILDSIPKDLKERYDNIINKIASGYSRMFIAFPQLSSKKFKKAFNDIREKIKTKVR